MYALEFNMNHSTNNISSVYDRDNISLFAILKYASNPNIGFIIGNGHLLFNLNRGDIKLGQILQITNTLTLLKKSYSEMFSKLNIILCGDLNAVPNSGVYKLLTQGNLDCSNIDRRKISGQNNGSIQYLNDKNLKGSILVKVTNKYDEKMNSNSNVSFVYLID